LDGLIDLTVMVARDFFARPQTYTDLSDTEAKALAMLYTRIGSSEEFLSTEQRRTVYSALFDPDEAHDYKRLRDPLLDAAATFAEWSQATGIPMLRERIKSAHRGFKEFLKGMSGASTRWNREVALFSLAEDICYPVLRDSHIAAAFGVTKPPSDAWPFKEDAQGDKLVEEISRRLSAPKEIYVTRESFSARQRTALRGAEAIAAVLSLDTNADDDSIDILISRLYTWRAALQASTPVVEGLSNKSVRRLPDARSVS
jgi:hypothetical protein